MSKLKREIKIQETKCKDTIMRLIMLPLLTGSSGSVQSWASSLSADSQSEEAAADFMKAFVPLLFDAPNSIDQEQKANFGQMVLVSIG